MNLHPVHPKCGGSVRDSWLNLTQLDLVLGCAFRNPDKTAFYLERLDISGIVSNFPREFTNTREINICSSTVGFVPAGKLRSFMSSVRAVLSSNKHVALDVSAAKHALNVAWSSYRQSTIQHYKEGLDFGRVCHEWRAKYKAQGSRKGKGFDHLLQTIGIPKTTAYRWIHRYEVKNGLRTKRNEVADIHRNWKNKVADRPTLFRFVLSSEQRIQFDDDIHALGGPESVARMFLDFVARIAFEKRASDGVIAKKAISAEDYRRRA